MSSLPAQPRPPAAHLRTRRPPAHRMLDRPSLNHCLLAVRRQGASSATFARRGPVTARAPLQESAWRAAAVAVVEQPAGGGDVDQRQVAGTAAVQLSIGPRKLANAEPCGAGAQELTRTATRTSTTATRSRTRGVTHRHPPSAAVTSSSTRPSRSGERTPYRAADRHGRTPPRGPAAGRRLRAGCHLPLIGKCLQIMNC